MKNYREKTKVNCRITAVLSVILIAFSIFALCAEAGLVELTPVAGDSHWQSRWRGFVSGASVGVATYMVINLVKALRALKDEKKLKALYVKEHDERTQAIYTAARAAAMQLSSGVGLVAAIIAGYFNITVSLTLLVFTCFLAYSGVAFKFYYSKKF